MTKADKARRNLFQVRSALSCPSLSSRFGYPRRQENAGQDQNSGDKGDKFTSREWEVFMSASVERRPTSHFHDKTRTRFVLFPECARLSVFSGITDQHA